MDYEHRNETKYRDEEVHFLSCSDVDVMVEFQPGVRGGLAFIRMQDELAAILG